MIVTRADLQLTAELCHRIMDDPVTDEPTRELARRVNDRVGWSLCYDVFLTDGEVPCETWGMVWPQFYEVEVENFIDQLPDRAKQPTLLLMARKAAKLVDTHGYSPAYRLDTLKSLEAITDTLRRLAFEHEEVTT
ncbi:hypothetical protein DQP58_00085 [Mycobacterium colombiense]|uniref:Uncharacterized protein n=1 Tax=Mycobacterium colombiense TaxID=339268 RepID=A0A329L1M4_9MYCO|nr:hypothetical protein [Mycobacterium colombiense]RAV00673.1 hypothetical protein DQP58_00085 [Mycobacterium colombiense]